MHVSHSIPSILDISVRSGFQRNKDDDVELKLWKSIRVTIHHITMFRPRSNAAGGSSKDPGQGALPGVSSETAGTPATADGVINESQASLPGIGEESFISRMMADKYVLHS
jgi:hypothetical protein